MRVSVPIGDLVEALTPEPALSGVGGGRRGDRGADRGGSTSNVDAIRLSRARTVPSSLDLRGARVDEALAALDRYLEDGSLAGLERVTIIHGLGTGALRDAVRSAAAAHPLVKDVRAGERGEGGDGATIVSLG
jgi:DNA mismatch repair protein MutS2